MVQRGNELTCGTGIEVSFSMVTHDAMFEGMVPPEQRAMSSDVGVYFL